MSTPSADERCSNCGHRTDRRVFCSTCKREFSCGVASEPCGRDGCADRVMTDDLNHGERWETLHAGDFDALEVPRGEEPQ